MRFLAIYKTPETGVPPTAAQMAEMGRFIEEVSRAGVLLETGGCLPSAQGARVRLAGGKMTVTDGPFTESKELVAGYAVLQTKNKEEAVEWTKRFLRVAGDGESEIRQVFEAGECSGQVEPKMEAVGGH
ncbi:MAG TPA: YciI family protein [Thermoanaerobaculia bacterium]|nr:YciI family protein [Thermoanaerobaculia bacterium]